VSFREVAVRAWQVTGHGYKQDFLQMVASGIVTPAQWRRERCVPVGLVPEMNTTHPRPPIIAA
jgi:hypothetical protein